jgi:hypothetical protein
MHMFRLLNPYLSMRRYGACLMSGLWYQNRYRQVEAMLEFTTIGLHVGLEQRKHHGHIDQVSMLCPMRYVKER